MKHPIDPKHYDKHDDKHSGNQPQRDPNQVSDDDLVLVFYGEHDDPQLAGLIANTPALARRFAELSEQLAGLEHFTAPTPGADYGAGVWRRIEAELVSDHSPTIQPSGFWRRLFNPQFSLAGVTLLVGAMLVAFWFGQQSRVPEVGRDQALADQPSRGSGQGAQPSAQAQLNPARLLTSRVAEHLSATDRLLTQRINTDSGPTAVPESEWAMDLLLSNRLYRRAANRAGHNRLAALLDEIEPLLLELAHDPSQQANQPTDVQQADRDLLLRVRVMNGKLDGQLTDQLTDQLGQPNSQPQI